MIEYRHKDEAPCKNCKDRHPACHSECKGYKEWLEVLDKEKELFWKAEAGNCAHSSLVADHKNRYVKAKIRKRK